MKPIKKAVTVTGQYIDKSGQEKNRYLRIGTLFERDDGSQCLKIEAIPVAEPGWTGWINFYDLDNNRQQSADPEEPPRGRIGNPNIPGGGGLDDSDIPF